MAGENGAAVGGLSAGGGEGPAPAGNDVFETPVSVDELWGDAGSDGASADSPAGAKKPAEPAGDYDFEDPIYAGEAAEGDGEQRPAGDQGGQKPAREKSDPSPEFTPEQLMRAARLGFTPNDLQDFGTPRALERAIQREEALYQRQIGQGGQQQKPADNPFAKFTDPNNFKAKIDRKALIEQHGFDEGMVTQLEALADQMAANLVPAFQQAAALQEWAQKFHGAVSEQLVAQQQREQRRQVDEWNQQFEREIDDLPEEWQETLSDADARKRVHTMCGVVANSMHQLGQDIPKPKALVAQALAMTFGQKQKAVVREQVQRDLHRRDARGMARARPGGARQPQTGEEAAVKFLNDKLYRPSGLMAGRRRF